MFLCRLGARRQVGLLLRNGPSTEKFAALFHVESFPHGDTMDNAFPQLDPDEGQEVVCALMRNSSEKKSSAASVCPGQVLRARDGRFRHP